MTLFVVLFIFFGMAGIAGAYMAPTIIAFRKDHEHRWFIAIANVFSGWTGVAWFPLLLWACRVIGPREIVAPGHHQVVAAVAGKAAKSLDSRAQADPRPRIEPRIDPPAKLPPPAPPAPGLEPRRALKIQPRSNW